VSSAALIVAGNASVDLLLGTVEPWPRPGTETLVERFAWRVGGALGNAALALADLGVPATLVYDVGNDAMGDWLTQRLAHAGDPPRVLPAATSVTVAIHHPDGERTFLSHLGHLAASEPDALARAIDRAAPGDTLLVGGSFLLPRWRPALPELLAAARARGIVTALDTGWPSEGWTTPVRNEVTQALAHVDVFLPNLEEARGLLAAPHAPPASLAGRLAERCAGVTILKLGADGAGRVEGGRFRTYPAPRITVVDTVGAGDTFDAALLAARGDGAAWSEAIEIAVAAASGAVASEPRRIAPLSTLRRAVASE
jgi:ribokinase